MYGQFDKFVRIQFRYGSQAYKDFGSSIMGVFLYTLEERTALESLFKSEINHRTDRNIKFKPTDIDDELNEEQKVKLDRDGFLCSDIDIIWSSNLGSTNRFASSSEKEIPNLMTINFDSSGFNVNNAIINLYSRRMKDGPALCPDELDEYYGIVLYFLERQGDSAPEYFFDEDHSVKQNILLHKYKAMLNDLALNEEDQETYIKLMVERSLKRVEVIKQELKRAGTSLAAVIKKNNLYMQLIQNLCMNFEGKTLLYSSPPVWWDFERYIHIYLRHIKFFKDKDIFTERTNFQYKPKMVKKIIEIVLELLKDEIEAHFKNTPEKSFKRIGQRSAYYDGVYYVIEIEPSGRLVWLHPRN